MTARYWIKLYIEILDDPKMGMLQPWLWQRAITFFLAAGEYNQEGLLPPVEQLAWRLRTTIGDLIKSLGALSEVGITVETPDGWLVKNFTKRQEPSSTERVRQYRERKQKQQYYGNANGNKSETKRYIDAESESEEDSDVDVVHDNDPPTLGPLSAAFVESTHIPELTGGVERWTDALKKMMEAGVEPDDLRAAVKELRNKKFQIAGPWSCVNAAIIVMSRRKSGGDGAKPLEGYEYVGS